MLTCPERRFRLRLKTTATAVLLISVFISSSFLIQSARAPTPTPQLFIPFSNPAMIPSVGSCNPFANSLVNSERFLALSGYDDLSGSPQASDDGQASIYSGSGQVVREVAVYANGNEPMAVAISYANADTSNGYISGLANAFLGQWPYQIYSKTTGKFLGSKTYYSNITIDLNYSFSMTVTGPDALAQGTIYFGNATAQYEQGSGYGAAESGGSPEGTLNFTYSGYGGVAHPLTMEATAIVTDEYAVNSPSEAQAVVDPYLYIDPSSPLASQLQVYVGKTANANPNDASQWTPSVQTPINLNNIVPLATPFANSTASPSSSSTPTIPASPIVTEFSSQLIGTALVVSILIALPAVIIAKKKITSKNQLSE